MDSRTTLVLLLTASFPTRVDRVIERLKETTGGRGLDASIDAVGRERSWAEPHEAARWRRDADRRML